MGPRPILITVVAFTERCAWCHNYLDSVSGDPVDAVPALVRSDGAEFGLRFETGAQLKTAITALLGLIGVGICW